MRRINRKDFDKSIHVGEEGVADILPIILEWPTTDYIIDLQDKWNEDDSGTDIIIVNKNGREITCDVKTDTTYCKQFNIFVETIGNIKYKTPGWFKKNTCEYIVYYFIKRQQFYMIPLKGLRAWLLTPTETGTVLESYPIKNGNSERNGEHWTSEGHVVEVDHLLDNVKHVRVYDVKLPCLC